ncbi:flagellar FlbD family protein [Oceanirhabdus seepicola]|uniref:Flagellar FlbD family protein n=1 Tax=Oceanirhabdus seepicola TaxID=2828781 RepID=A0A9J6P7A0_9CLOT|nr:flagellar FlbD family protein [Oceanirhabdus seepicola]MCM1992655.1 flagellar FlbD family protein [Oceanirhabdus seepicola]
MIEITGLNNKEFVLNYIHIEKIEEVPETLITLTNGKKYLVLETTDEIIAKCIAYQKKAREFEHLK